VKLKNKDEYLIDLATLVLIFAMFTTIIVSEPTTESSTNEKVQIETQSGIKVENSENETIFSNKK